MKPILTLLIVIIFVGMKVSDRPDPIQPCSKEMEIKFYYNGKLIHYDNEEWTSQNGQIIKITCHNHVGMKIRFIYDSVTYKMREK